MKTLIAQCCVCRKIRTSIDIWIVIDEKELEGLDITHTYCPECYKDVKREMEQSRL